MIARSRPRGRCAGARLSIRIQRLLLLSSIPPLRHKTRFGNRAFFIFLIDSVLWLLGNNRIHCSVCDECSSFVYIVSITRYFEILCLVQ